MAQLPTLLCASQFSSPAWACSAAAQQLTARKPEPSLSLADTLAPPTCLADVWDQAVSRVSYLRRLDIGLCLDLEIRRCDFCSRLGLRCTPRAP